MLRARVIGHYIGRCLLALSTALLIPLFYGLAIGDDGIQPLLVGVFTPAVSGLILLFSSRRVDEHLSSREALLLVASAWISVSLFGSIPFLLSPYFETFTDSFFESVSGFTTTGATILPDVETLPASIQLWRHLTQWLGGMGVLLLGIAILPRIGLGGVQLYRTEFSGVRSEGLKPRIQETASALWRIYLALTVAEALALGLAGMPAFDAVCHSFSTIGTGGFSTRRDSIAAFDSPVIEAILIVFMLLAGMSFVQHYRIWKERRTETAFSDFELRGYVGTVALATLIVFASLAFATDSGVLPALRSALFHVSAMITTTGFTTADFQIWYPLGQVTLLALMFVGGSTASTAGGLKIARILLLAGIVNREFKHIVERRAVFAVRLGRESIGDGAIRGLLNLVYLAFLVNLTACLLLALTGIDVITAIAAVAACMFNVGPGLAVVDSFLTYADMPHFAKWVLTAVMIAGRLEFYAIFAILTPAFWKR